MAGVTKEEVQEIMDLAFATHEKREIENMEQRLEQFRHELVPEGQTAPHKSYHQSLVDAAEAQQLAEEERAKLYRTLQTKVLEKGIEGAFGALRILVLLGLGALILKLGVKIPDWAIALLGVAK